MVDGTVALAASVFSFSFWVEFENLIELVPQPHFHVIGSRKRVLSSVNGQLVFAYGRPR